jgi:hypothetical protein
MYEIGSSLKAVFDTITLDLTTADLAGSEQGRLYGVRALWSFHTVWPPGIADRVHASSPEIASGIFLK